MELLTMNFMFNISRTAGNMKDNEDWVCSGAELIMWVTNKGIHQNVGCYKTTSPLSGRQGYQRKLESPPLQQNSGSLWQQVRTMTD